MAADAAPTAEGRKKRMALRFVLLIGVLSFFADFTYEGSAVFWDRIWLP